MEITQKIKRSIDILNGTLQNDGTYDEVFNQYFEHVCDNSMYQLICEACHDLIEEDIEQLKKYLEKPDTIDQLHLADIFNLLKNELKTDESRTKR